jgi:hypothetical protein
MNPRIIFFFILGLDAFVLFTQTSQLSISYYEAKLLYGEVSALQYIIKISLYLFGQNDFALRFPMILMHSFSAMLLFKISKDYVYSYRNRLWLIIVFLLLPGVISSALIVNSAGLIIFGLLLFIYIYQNYSLVYTYPLLILLLLIDNGFQFLFIALAFKGLNIKNKLFFIFNIFLFIVSVYMHRIGAHGSPSGHFLDTIGIYATVFTPIIFIYLFYTLYRRYLNKNFDILWYISTTALVISLILSFRQKMHVEYFAPYLIIALPIMGQVFIHSYRVRLKIFRKKYKIFFSITLMFLLVNSSIVFYNKYLYLLIQNPKKHFAYKMQVARELAQELKKKDIYCIDADKKMSLRLRFYGISECKKYYLLENNLNSSTSSNVTISYNNKAVYKATVTKLNIN